MDAIDDALAQLRKLGHEVGIPYVQAGAEPAGGRICIPIDGVGMTYLEIMEFTRRQLAGDKHRTDKPNEV